jgi:hypothetical protein
VLNIQFSKITTGTLFALWIAATATIYPTSARAVEHFPTTTLDATNITATSATLNGTFVADGSNFEIVLSFDMDTTSPPSTRYTAAESPTPILATGAQSFTYAATGLTCNTTYYYRAFVDDTDGYEGTGNEVSFTTLPCSSPPPQSVPTLSQWVMLLLAGVLGMLGFAQLRRS